jgi:hypothetical protein
MNGPTWLLAKLGEPAAPVSTIPPPLGFQPLHERWIPGVPVVPAVQDFPRSESVRRDAFAAVVPAVVCFADGAAAAAEPAKSTAASRTAGSFTKPW